MIALWLGCTLGEAAPEPGDPPFALVFERAGEVARPTAIATPPAGPDVPWITSQPGRVHTLDGALVVDIEARVEGGGEMGLLGLAFHPRWPEDPRIFVNYTYKVERRLFTRIASFRSADGGKTLDPASEVEVLSFSQPWSNHNAGALQFGPDGKLYAAVGDGGSGGDPRGTGQDRADLLGSILRLDVDTPPYVVPADNPFLGEPGARGEIWAYGVRNPWGMHFDGATRGWADVGQDAWEEVDRGVKGGNYGWNRVEGTHCYEVATCAGDFVAPVAEYGRKLGSSVTGGLVYRGPSVPALDGKYVFADFSTGRFFAVDPAGGPVVGLGASGMHPSTFGRDRAGRLYVADYGSGTIFRLRAP